MGDWIKCNERLPEQGERVLATWSKMVGEAYLKQDGKWYRFGTDMLLWIGEQITHWMPLPEPPEENRNMMEKLTYKTGRNITWIKKLDEYEICENACALYNEEAEGEPDCNECPLVKAFEHLAAYEYSGLTPAEVSKLVGVKAKNEKNHNVACLEALTKMRELDSQIEELKRKRNQHRALAEEIFWDKYELLEKELQKYQQAEAEKIGR